MTSVFFRIKFSLVRSIFSHFQIEIYCFCLWAMNFGLEISSFFNFDQFPNRNHPLFYKVNEFLNDNYSPRSIFYQL